MPNCSSSSSEVSFGSECWGCTGCCGCHPSSPCAAQESHTQTLQTSTGQCCNKLGGDKETTYPELVRSGRCRLVVLAMEMGGRWSEETVSVIHQLAIARAREVLSYMSHQVALAWERRWAPISFAAPLVEPSLTLLVVVPPVGWHPASLC